jgi:hypothetical protein
MILHSPFMKSMAVEDGFRVESCTKDRGIPLEGCDCF